MNGFTVKENTTFKEKYYFKKLDSGLRITVIPKDMPSKSAFLCCDFGGSDIEYTLNGKNFKLPYGTAHFLEHKMFETADGSDAFLEFDNFGGNANAFTSYENTCYYFSCTENFFENLDVLLSSVSALHCTDDSIEKEKMIISREITMYEDLPSSVAARNLCKGLYHHHPTVNSISGTIDDISGITKDILEQAYNHFYVPQNLSLCIYGDLDLDKITKYAEKYFGNKSHERPITVFKPETPTVRHKKIIENGVVASPLYSIGIKYPALDRDDYQHIRLATALRLAISLTFGRASDFYCNNYAQGLINERFFAGFTNSRMASQIIISGSGNQPEKVMENALAEIQFRKNNFFTSEQILREKRAAYAESLTIFDNGEDIASAMAITAFLNHDEFDLIEILRDITEEEIKLALSSIDINNVTISIVTN